MELTNSFVVDAPPEVLWDVLNDVERFAPFIPGFVLTEADGDRYLGRMKVKVGAVTAQYDVEVVVKERNAAEQTVKAVASGRERKGAGTMQAHVTGVLSPNGDKTEATILTDLQVTGRVAQFGRNILGEVAEKLLTKFARDLETHVLAGDSPEEPDTVPAAGAPTATGSTTPARDEVLDLVDLAGESVAKRMVPVGIGVAVLAVLVYLISRK